MKRLMKVCLAAAMLLILAVGFLSPIVFEKEAAAMLAVGECGKPYVLGAYGPVRYDCSGLVLSSFAPFGLELPHSAKEVGYAEEIRTISSPLLLRAGDLVFFDTISDSDACDHVGIWLGMGRFVHASSSEGVVMVSTFDDTWRNRFSWGKRLS